MHAWALLVPHSMVQWQFGFEAVDALVIMRAFVALVARMSPRAVRANVMDFFAARRHVAHVLTLEAPFRVIQQLPDSESLAFEDDAIANEEAHFCPTLD